MIWSARSPIQASISATVFRFTFRNPVTPTEVFMLRRALRSPAKSPAFTLIELMVVLIILATIIALLLPALSKRRESAIASKMAGEGAAVVRSAPAAPRLAPQSAAQYAQDTTAMPQKPPAPALPLAAVTAFSGKVELTPRLS